MSGKMENFGFWLSRTFASTKSSQASWPHVPGKYFVKNAYAPVAVTTLGSVDFAKQVSECNPKHLCIVGKVETENIGIEKIIKNIIANPHIRFLLMVGNEPPKHLTGATLNALFVNGVDELQRIVGSPGMRPQLPNTSVEEVERFTQQVELVDMIGCTDVAQVQDKITELGRRSPGPFTGDGELPPSQEDVPVVHATYHDPDRIKLDPEGYFVIHVESGELLVEHYSYKEQRLRIIKGTTAREICLTIAENGWLSRIDHACYLGKELTRAEMSMRDGLEFVQDGA